MCQGDAILKINGIDCKAVTHGSCVDILRKAGEKVNLTIGRKTRKSTSLSEKEQSLEIPPPMPGKLKKIDPYISIFII